MITTKRPNYSSNSPFEKFVAICQKNVMADLADLLILPVKKSLRKELFLSEMARLLIRYVPQLLKQFPTYEVELLSRVLDAPKGVGVAMPGLGGRRSMLITECCFVVCRQIGEDDCQYFLTTEALREQLTLALAEARKYYEQHPYYVKCERLAVGMMNYFGGVPDIWVLKRCSDLLSGNVINVIEIYDILNYPLFRMCRQTVIDDSLPKSSPNYKRDFFVSPMLEEVGFILEEQESRPEIHPDYLSVPEEVLLAYGTMPYVKPVRPCEKAMYDYLKSSPKLDQEKLDWYYTKLWYQVQREQKPQDSLSSLSDLCQFRSIDELQSALNIFTEFSNNTPKWILSGMSSHEVYEKYEKPKMRSLTNMPFSSPFPSSPFVAQPKVGRNDPCPCGSGKKYKHCCGK